MFWLHRCNVIQPGASFQTHFFRWPKQLKRVKVWILLEKVNRRGAGCIFNHQQRKEFNFKSSTNIEIDLQCIFHELIERPFLHHYQRSSFQFLIRTSLLIGTYTSSSIFIHYPKKVPTRQILTFMKNDNVTMVYSAKLAADVHTSSRPRKKIVAVDFHGYIISFLICYCMMIH